MSLSCDPHTSTLAPATGFRLTLSIVFPSNVSSSADGGRGTGSSAGGVVVEVGLVRRLRRRRLMVKAGVVAGVALQPGVVVAVQDHVPHVHAEYGQPQVGEGP